MRAVLAAALGLCLGLTGLTPSPAQEEPAAPPADAVRFEGVPVTRARDAALLLSGQDGGSVGADLELWETPEGRVRARVRFDAVRLPAQVVLYVVQGNDVTTFVAHRVAPSSKMPAEPPDGLRVVLDTPLELPSGPARVRLLVRSGEDFGLRTATTTGSASEDAPNAVSPPGEPRLALELAPQVDEARERENVSGGTPGAGPSVAGPPPGTDQVETMVRRWVAQGERRSLEALEVELTATRPDDVLNLLDTVYRRIEASLVSADPHAVQTLAVAHMERAWSHGEMGRGSLARLAAEQAILAAETYVRLRGDAQDRAWASRLLGVLAGRRLTVGRISAAETLFRRALEWNPDNAASRLGLASLLEKTGRFDEAGGLLEPLVRSSFGGDEVRLRRALCRLRHRPKDREAARELRRLSVDARPPWVAVLATEERARWLIRRGDLETAGDVLEAAHRRWPELQSVAVQRARLLDGEGRSREARSILSDLPTSSPTVEDAPRTRYNRWPMDGLTEGRHVLVEEAREHRPALARALSGGASSEAP